MKNFKQKMATRIILSFAFLSLLYIALPTLAKADIAADIAGGMPAAEAAAKAIKDGMDPVEAAVTAAKVDPEAIVSIAGLLAAENPEAAVGIATALCLLNPALASAIIAEASQGNSEIAAAIAAAVASAAGENPPPELEAYEAAGQDAPGIPRALAQTAISQTPVVDKIPASNK